MRLNLVAAAILSTGLIFIPQAAPQARTGTSVYPELAPLPLSEQLSSAREPLPLDTIIDAALEFSGAADTDPPAARDALTVLMRKFRDEVANVTSQADLAERALTFLHKSLFTTYSVAQTRVDVALETGVYNCVSSAVLYLVVARSVGLSVSGVRTVDHAFASVLVNGLPVDVETTNPLGFNPGAHKDFTDSFGKITGYSYVPPGNYQDRRAIGEKELLSLILTNRVAEAMDARAFRDALQPAVSVFTLMGTDDSREVLKIALGNYVIWLAVRHDYSQGVQFIDAVKASFGGIVDLEGPRRDIYHNWAVSLIDGHDLAEAETLLSQPAARTVLGDADWTDLSSGIVERQAMAEAGVSGSLSAAAVIAEGIRKLGRLPVLLQNFEAYIHNAFAPLYNTRKLTEARGVLDQGLAVYPDSRLIQQDLELLRKTPRA